MPKLQLGGSFPNLEVQVLDRSESHLEELTGGQWSIVMIYRDEDCPKCQAYFDRVAQNREDIEKQDVQLVAVSADSEAGARAIRDSYGLWFPLVHSLPLSVGDELGIYTNPERGTFEPAFFLLDPNLKVVHASIQSGPMARPLIEELLALAAAKKSQAESRV